MYVRRCDHVAWAVDGLAGTCMFLSHVLATHSHGSVTTLELLDGIENDLPPE